MVYRVYYRFRMIQNGLEWSIGLTSIYRVNCRFIGLRVARA